MSSFLFNKLIMLKIIILSSQRFLLIFIDNIDSFIYHEYIFNATGNTF